MATARYHKVKIGEQELDAETLMLGYGYDPSLSESAARWPAASSPLSAARQVSAC